MGQSQPLFVYFRSFLVTIPIIQIEKSIDGVLGIRTWGRSYGSTHKNCRTLGQWLSWQSGRFLQQRSGVWIQWSAQFYRTLINCNCTENTKRCRNDPWKLFGTHIFNNEIICCIHFAAYWLGWPVRKLLQPLCSMRLLVLKCRFGVKDMSLLFIWAQLRLQHLKMWRSGYRILMKCSLIRYKCWSYCLQLYLL